MTEPDRRARLVQAVRANLDQFSMDAALSTRFDPEACVQLSKSNQTLTYPRFRALASELHQVLRESLNTYRTRALCLPLRLPLDIVLLVVHHGGPEVRDILSQTCSAWRQLLLAHPSVWKAVHWKFEGVNPLIPLRLQLQRSGELEVDVVLDLQDWNTINACEDLKACLYRIRTLKLRIDLDSARVTAQLVDAEHEYRLHDARHQHLPVIEAMAETLCDTAAPCLRELVIEDDCGVMKLALLRPWIIDEPNPQLFAEDAPLLHTAIFNFSPSVFGRTEVLSKVTRFGTRLDEDEGFVETYCPNVSHLTLRDSWGYACRLPETVQTLVLVSWNWNAVQKLSQLANLSRIPHIDIRIHDDYYSSDSEVRKIMHLLLEQAELETARLVLTLDERTYNWIADFDWHGVRRIFRNLWLHPLDSTDETAVFVRSRVCEMWVSLTASSTLRITWYPWPAVTDIAFFDVDPDLITSDQKVVLADLRLQFPKLATVLIVCPSSNTGSVPINTDRDAIITFLERYVGSWTASRLLVKTTAFVERDEQSLIVRPPDNNDLSILSRIQARAATLVREDPTFDYLERGSG